MKFNRNSQSRQLAYKGGTYSLATTAIVLAIVVMVNVFVSMLPSSVTRQDISAAKLYSVTSNTKVVVNSLQQDVTIYWIVQADKEDDIIENLLNKYESLSDHIQVVKKNPDVFPTFAEQYTNETVPNNSLVVEAGDRYRYISYNDIYLQELDTYSYSYSTSFDGEGAITSAIDYVVTEDLPVMYLLEGHGEEALPSVFAESVEKSNIVTEQLSLLSAGEVPEEADCVMIYAPQRDISEEEKKILEDYADNGGKLLVISGPLEEGVLTNLNALLEAYGVETVEGIVVEEEPQHYAFGYPYILLPDMISSTVTDSLMQEHYYPVMPLVQGLLVGSGGKGTVTELLTTSDMAFSKAAGFALTGYEREEGDTDGPFAAAVSVETEGAGQIIWFSSYDFLQDMYNAYSSGANNDLAMNAVSALIGEREAMAIRSKSLNYNYLTISSHTSGVLKTLMIGIFPLAYLAVGLVIVLRKRSRQRELAL